MPWFCLISFSLLLPLTVFAADESAEGGFYRAGLRHIEGGGIGYAEGYTTLEAFLAPDHTQWKLMPFFDARGHVFNNGKAAANAGIGLRTECEEQFTQVGYLEICGVKQSAEAFDALYASFDRLIAYLQTHPAAAQKLYGAKERFIRTKDRNYYSADFFGFYDESERAGRNQVAFYYSIHFHEFIDAYYPEIRRIDEIVQFFDACFEMQKPYGAVFEDASAQLGLDAIFYSEYGRPPILFKVIKYLPSDGSTRPHYDGSVFSLFLDSTDNQSLLLSPYKSTLIADDFFCPQRECADSILLIPGLLLAEFSIYPTPHVVLKKRNIRYAAVAFAMRPNFKPERSELAPLPHFSVE